MKRLSPEEITSRCERGLCFNCDERYHRGHRCASRVFLLITEEEDPPSVNIDPNNPQPNTIPDPPEVTDPYPAHISLHSLSDHHAPETLRFEGVIHAHPLVLLVDGGSTHNFVQQQLVSRLGLPCRSTPPLRVMVGNGHHLECTTICEVVPISIQNIKFLVDLYVLPIAGANIVLGVQWLKTLGPLLTDYNSLSMQFFYQHRLVQLKGESEAQLGLLNHHQLRRLHQTHEPVTYFHIAILTENTSPTSSPPLPQPIQHLLDQFSALFQEPQGLPPA